MFIAYVYLFHCSSFIGFSNFVRHFTDDCAQNFHFGEVSTKIKMSQCNKNGF